MWIIVLSILGVVILSVTIYLWRSWYKDIDNDPALTGSRDEGQLRRFVREMPVLILEDKGTEYKVGFQGGLFYLSYTSLNDSFEVTFNVAHLPYEELPQALIAANTINNKYKLWRCSAKIEPMGIAEEPCTISISCYVSLSDREQAFKRLDTCMGVAFYVARDCEELFSKEKKTNAFTPERLKDLSFKNQLQLISNRWATLPHTSAAKETADTAHGREITIRHLLTLWDNVAFGALVALRILAEGRIEKITHPEEILAFNIYDFLSKHHAEAWANDFTLQLMTENEGLLFWVRRATGGTDKTLFYNMQVYRTGGKGAYNLDAYFNEIRIEIRLTPYDNDIWETKYMIDEALSKHHKDGFENLTEMEKAIVAMTTDTLQAHIYWGKRYYLAKCFYQALEHFRFVYCHCRDNWQKLNKRGRDTYFEVCYYIGFIYMDMHIMERAHYFLQIAAQTNNITFMEELVNCLCNMKDPAALRCITTYLNQVNDFLSDNEPNDGVMAFKEFLYRRYAYVLIDLRMYAEARQHLNRMIDHGVSVDFAKKELAYLDRIEQAEAQETQETQETQEDEENQ